MTTRSFSTGLQTTRRPSIPNDFPNELSNDLQDESSMDLDNNNKNDNQQSTRQSFNDKQASNLPPEDLDDQQNGKLSFRARAPFNKILGNNRIVKMKFLKVNCIKIMIS
ncbi:unnamed protein product [Rhizophagus irregularis]|nr:unnamed protein product [Rhizophagus irregularis]CAB5386417.1 unnamed protein product [Rhizophagus irregularis]